MTDSSRTSSPLRLLVLAPNWLGDVVMTTPLLSFLHASRDAVLRDTGRPLVTTLGIRPAWGDLFLGDPRVDDLLIMDRGGPMGGLLGSVRLAGILKKGRYDAVLLGPPSLRTGLAAWMANIPCRVGYRTDARSVFLSHGIEPGRRGSRHYSREMIQLGSTWLDSLGLSGEPAPAGGWSSSLPGCDPLPAANTGSERPVWAVAPGTTYGEAKTWPVARLAEFIRLARDRSGARLVFLGDEAARGFTDLLKAEVPGDWGDDLLQEAALVDLTGRTDLVAAVKVLKSANVFIGNDSGLMHLAAALGRPTVGVFGSSNPDWTAPLGERTRAVFPEGFDCRPCYRKTCNQKIFCLDTVAAETVLDAVREVGGPGQELRGGAR